MALYLGHMKNNTTQMTNKQLSSQAQEILEVMWFDHFESAADKRSLAADILRVLIDECSEVRGTGRVDKKSQVVSVKTLMKLIEDLEQF